MNAMILCVPAHMCVCVTEKEDICLHLPLKILEVYIRMNTDIVQCYHSCTLQSDVKAICQVI